MKIMCVIPTLGQGGAQRVLVNLANRLAETDCVEVALVTFASSRMPPHHLPSSSVIVHYLEGISGGAASAIGVARCLLKLRHLIKNNNPDVVLAFQDIANFPAIVACAGVSTRLIVAERQDTQFYRFARFRSILRSVLYRFADRVVVQTERVRQQMPAAVRGKTTVIPNLVSEQSLKARPGTPIDGKFRIITVGRLAPQKNFPLLIEAASIVLRERKDWSLALYGEGELRSSLQSQINDLGMSERITLAGVTDDVYSQMACSHLFVLPSNYEGFPNVLGEAAAIGLPSIAFSDVSGVPDLIEQDQSGILLSGNQRTSKDLANSMAKLIDSKELRIRMGSVAQRITQRFNASTVYSDWEKELRPPG